MFISLLSGYLMPLCFCFLLSNLFIFFFLCFIFSKFFIFFLAFIFEYFEYNSILQKVNFIFQNHSHQSLIIRRTWLFNEAKQMDFLAIQATHLIKLINSLQCSIQFIVLLYFQFEYFKIAHFIIILLQSIILFKTTYCWVKFLMAFRCNHTLSGCLFLVWILYFLFTIASPASQSLLEFSSQMHIYIQFYF